MTPSGAESRVGRRARRSRSVSAALFALVALGGCRTPDEVTRHEQARFVATPPGASDELALGRIAVDPVERGPHGAEPRALFLRIYVENPGALPVHLDPASLRLVDLEDRALRRVRVEPTPPTTGFTIRPGRTRRFEAVFAFPEEAEPLPGGFFLEWRIERGSERATGRTRLVTDWLEPQRD